VGGGAKIATVIAVDLCRVAQARPGARIRLESIDLESAHGLCGEREALQVKIKTRFHSVGQKPGLCLICQMGPLRLHY
jgi:allophanate hydrolase subunit 2